ncbi:MAG TPA: DUF3071 domain-containing protein [Candidatus Corynebacterium avicola]|uniref:DUF3071 domain-containing protein n=1 Tax=Candidatus Corynebacterium avicola TaxID=2838527 RepID=A0A9D1RPB9_9CORY|nr:DUF3071 domain-containing protein [Candidatus Corynebacterium avicola]
MQELQFVQDDSDPSSLVLRAVDGDQEFFLAVTDELTEFLGVAAELSDQGATGDAAGQDDSAVAAAVSPVSTPTDSEETDGTDATPTADATDSADDADAGDTDDAPADAAPSVSAVSSEPSEPAESSVSSEVSAPAAEKIPHKDRIHLRPREIQDRIRHGETVEEIIAATGMEERRVRPYAVPIDMERARIADLARDAFPVRSDGPADQPLREVLATAFGARGESMRASTWTAAMDSSDHWVVSVSWEKGNRPGATRFVADFRYVPGGETPATAEPVNSVASDLIDPRFERPVRTVSPLIPSSVQAPGEDLYADDDGASDSADAADADHADPASGWGAAGSHPAGKGAGNAADADADAGDGRDGNAPVDLFGDRTDRADSAEGGRQRRKKQAVTPHWEDVLLGVRTNPRANGRNRKK